MRTALITSGGGAKGAFTVGALSVLHKRGFQTFDILSGTSTGALIAAIMADNTDPAANIALLREVYTSVTDEDIIRRGNLVRRLLDGENFIFGTEPLREMIRLHIDEDKFDRIMQSPANLCLTAVSMQSGRPTVFTTKHLPPTPRYNTRSVDTRALLVDALLASSDQAVFLPPVRIGNEQFVDGGIREVIPSQVVVDLSPDTVFLISNNPFEFQLEFGKSYDSIVDMLIRATSIFIQDVRENDVRLLTAFGNRPGKKLVQIKPVQDLDPENPTGLRFDVGLMMAWMRQGEIAAENALRDSELVV